MSGFEGVRLVLVTLPRVDQPEGPKPCTLYDGLTGPLAVTSDRAFQLAVPRDPATPLGGAKVAVDALTAFVGGELFHAVSCNAPPNRANDTPVASAMCVLRMRRFMGGILACATLTSGIRHHGVEVG